jgi:hypothetical protein
MSPGREKHASAFNDDLSLKNANTIWSQSYDFFIYSFNASVVPSRLEQFNIGEK